MWPPGCLGPAMGSHLGWPGAHIGHSAHCSHGHGGLWQGDRLMVPIIVPELRFPSNGRPPVFSQEMTIPAMTGTLSLQEQDLEVTSSGRTINPEASSSAEVLGVEPEICLPILETFSMESQQLPPVGSHNCASSATIYFFHIFFPFPIVFNVFSFP